jgi:hypothetical protein
MVDRAKNAICDDDDGDHILTLSSIVLTIKRRKAYWTDHILRRNCLLKHSIAGKIRGKIEVTGR